MAVKARFRQQDEDRHVILDLYPEQARVRSTDDPNLPGYDPLARLWFYWDDEKLEEGEREFLGVEASDIALLTEEDFEAIERLNPPRIDIPELSLFDVKMADVLRQARTVRLAWLNSVTL